jgi:hypothetical protein
VWSTAGYWNLDEWAKPVECTLTAAYAPRARALIAFVFRDNPGMHPPPCLSCLGTATTAATARTVGEEQCATGYIGELCAECDAGFYKDQVACRTCAGEDAEDARLVTIGFIALGLLAGENCLLFFSLALTYFVVPYLALSPLTPLGSDLAGGRFL